jgi:hypothetical protein
VLQVIHPATPLPTITDPVIIDGYTQGDAHASTSATSNDAAFRIAIRGDVAPSGTDGLTLGGTGGSTVKGLIVNGFLADGAGHGYSIRVQSSGNTIAGNFLSIHSGGAIKVAGDAGGVRIDSGSANVIGGTAPADQNVIGSLGNAIELHGPSSGTRVLGNLLGTDKTGMVALGASGAEILIDNSSGNVIGGTTAAARNLISGSRSAGIVLTGLSAQTNTIQGNFIGTDLAGTHALGNLVGVQFAKAAHNNRVGGTAAGAGNVISGNGNGLVFTGSGTSNNTVEGNFIGTDVSGATALGNTANGVKFIGGAASNLIGGATAASRNVISGNGASGVAFVGDPGASGGGGPVVGDLPGSRDLAGFLAHPFAANDDFSVASPIGFTLNFFGVVTDSLFVNNNGNVTFGRDLDQYTPTALNTDNGGLPIIAAFFADVDTRGSASQIVTYGNASLSGHTVFGVNFKNVGYFNEKSDKLNSFQLLLIERADTGAGNFDIEFDYSKIQWETGDSTGGGDETDSGGVNGFGGKSARIGFSNGTGDTGTFYELPGSGVNGAFLDGGSNALINASLGSTVQGRLRFEVRGGEVLGTPTSNTVQNNYIGTTLSGLQKIANGSSGVLLSGGAQSNRIQDNVISGNTGTGVILTGTGTGLNTVTGNRIGVDATGTGALGNRGNGISIGGNASGNVIGGITAGLGNTIANNGLVNTGFGHGVYVGPGSVNNSILANAITQNVRDGIRLEAASGQTTGNDGQHAPTLGGAYRNGSSTVFLGSLQAAAATAFRVELFTDDGTGEGKTFLGAFDTTTNASGAASFTQQLPVATALGQLITATATLKDQGQLTDTSAFAAARPVTVVVAPDDAAVVEGDTGDQLMQFTIRLNELSSGGATVSYHTAPFSSDARSATANPDYQPVTSGSVHFSSTDLTKTVSIAVHGDLSPEARERFKLVIDSAPSGPVVLDSEAVGTIIDDDQHTFAVAAGTGSKVQIYNSKTGALIREFSSFEDSFTGGVNVATGDVTGDGIDDVIVGAGTGGNGRVRIFDGASTSATPTALLDFRPFGTTYRGTVFVAAGDVNGDGLAEVIASSGTGSPAEVRVLEVSNGTIHTPTLLTTIPTFGLVNGGIHVAAGDLDGDGLADIIATNGVTPDVLSFHGDGTPFAGSLGKFKAFPTALRGLFAAAGDLDADGRDDLIFSVANGATNTATFLVSKTLVPTLSRTFFPFTGLFGVRVAVTDADSNGIADIVAAQGSGGDALVRVLKDNTDTELLKIKALGGVATGGLTVG